MPALRGPSGFGLHGVVSALHWVCKALLLLAAGMIGIHQLEGFLGTGELRAFASGGNEFVQLSRDWFWPLVCGLVALTGLRAMTEDCSAKSTLLAAAVVLPVGVSTLYVIGRFFHVYVLGSEMLVDWVDTWVPTVFAGAVLLLSGSITYCLVCDWRCMSCRFARRGAVMVGLGSVAALVGFLGVCLTTEKLMVGFTFLALGLFFKGSIGLKNQKKVARA